MKFKHLYNLLMITKAKIEVQPKKKAIDQLVYLPATVVDTSLLTVTKSTRKATSGRKDLFWLSLWLQFIAAVKHGNRIIEQ